MTVILLSLATQLCKIDARILRNVASMQQLELKLEPVSALDYRFILLPLVKSFMRVCADLYVLRKCFMFYC